MQKKLTQHKDTYFFGYGIDIEKPIELANKIIDLQQENQQLKEQLKQKEALIKKIENIFDDPNNSFSDGCDCRKIEKLLDNKGE